MEKEQVTTTKPFMTRNLSFITAITVGFILQILSSDLQGAVRMNSTLKLSATKQETSIKEINKRNDKINLIPQPVKVENHAGFFRLSSTTKLVSTHANKDITDLFAAMLKAPTGYTLGHAISSNNGIHFAINRTFNNALGNEGYILDVKPSRINIFANKPAGLFYGMQTLMQLLPKEIESQVKTKDKNWLVLCVKITDYPRFGWRGLMLDVSRHFFPKEMVKKYIDQLAKYKMNVFHWHLTDDQGWRIEIKSLPKLAEIGAWRVPRVGLWGLLDPQAPGEVATYGGYYN